MRYWLLIVMSSACFASYTPWYTGPLIATSAGNVPVGHAYIEPIVWGGGLYGIYDKHWSQHDTRHTLYQLNYTLTIGFGLVRQFVDAEITIQGFSNYLDGRHKTSWGDTSGGIGIQILREDHQGWRPSMRLFADVIIPTGMYNSLDDRLEGIDGVGRGSWTFSPILAIKKSFKEGSDHPFRANLNLNYSTGTTTAIQGRSIYGGSKLTHGSVRPGDQILVNLSFEYSLTQKWVFGLENIYQHTFESRFSGQSGGTRVGLPSSDVFSIAPELEYNISSNYGWIGGVWFSVAGRNVPSFASGAISFLYYF